ncbi:hypothetical protein [Acaryochloris thomasi]|uniref:hypothetical protein n=1 Tax=Acaryochloris thomasi TaxID=2929456 RepID=UPI001F281F4E|nr:hypothetical protein [Acaryochloris thomasi]
MKRATKKVLPSIAGVWVVLLLMNLPAMINPTPLSRVRERFVVQTILFGILTGSVEIFAKE